jgi:hypothetical protein
MSKFVKPHNGAQAKVSDGELTFTYIDSYGDVITETKPILTPYEICQKVKDRMERFKMVGPGSRESEISRAERKWLAAHPVDILHAAWNKLDGHGQMEMSMMFNPDSHFGISSQSWAKQYSDYRSSIVGDNGVPL